MNVRLRAPNRISNMDRACDRLLLFKVVKKKQLDVNIEFSLNIISKLSVVAAEKAEVRVVCGEL